ncbi:hypothetical protein [Planctomicrobium sp. SH664]|uniref:hypothetical protein n=1 Tax=Planctomicrobium sp. SH664 TaxID=3448125 RepID=UPI003F5B272A
MAVKSAPPAEAGVKRSHVVQPVLKVTFFDRLSAGMIALVFGLAMAVFCVFIWWFTNRPPAPPMILAPMEMMDGRGGDPDGVAGESLRVESPEDYADNASPVADAIDDSLVSAISEAPAGGEPLEFSEFGTKVAPQQQNFGEVVTVGGTPGSSDGTGNRRGLGNGPGPGGGGLGNEQRWFVRFADEAGLNEYANQLDFFNIELGALFRDGRMVYLSKVAQPQPVKRETRSGKDEQRLYMTWQGGSRKEADVKLFAKAGVDVTGATLFHFYPKQTEQLLLTQEYAYAKKRTMDISRTYFSVVKQGSGYAFVVTRQNHLR